MLFLNRDLAFRLEDGLREGNRQVIESWNALDSTVSMQAIEVDGGLAIYGGDGCPINEAVGLGMPSAVDEATLREIEEFYEANGHDTVIRVCPLAHPSLIGTVRKRGYVLGSFAYRWVLDLSSWESPLDEADPRVRQAVSAEEMAWARAICAGFEDADDVPEDRGVELEQAFFRMTGATPMIAIESGEPAAGGTVAMNHEVAALFGASTRLSYRRRGLQTALLDARLRLAKGRGVSIATIETEPDTHSQRNVERMGFRLAYAVAQMKRPQRRAGS